MKLKATRAIADHFKDIEDPRVERTKAHLLLDIIVITIFAVICDANGLVSIAKYGEAKYE